MGQKLRKEGNLKRGGSTEIIDHIGTRPQPKGAPVKKSALVTGHVAKNVQKSGQNDAISQKQPGMAIYSLPWPIFVDVGTLVAFGPVSILHNELLLKFAPNLAILEI